MSGLAPEAKRLCVVCSQPFYDPEQGARRDYRYTARYVSDNHRVMFHSGNDRDLNYDPEYYAASNRLEQRMRDNSARAWADYGERASRFADAARGALESAKETPDVSRETGDDHADH